ncbi:MAG: hypothetical protein Q9167_006794, partial [Letrouitia subvulpina]
MELNADSRTASFVLRNPRGQNSHPKPDDFASYNGSSDEGTKLSPKQGYGQNSTTEALISGARPVVNWNTGKNVNIRASLLRRPKTAEGASSVVPAMEIVEETFEASSNDSSPQEPQRNSINERRRLFIGNLSYNANDADLREFFAGFVVTSVVIPSNTRTNRPAGYAFVDFSSSEEAESAIEKLNGKAILQRKVSLQLARENGHSTADASSYTQYGAEPSEISASQDRRKGFSRNAKSDVHQGRAETDSSSHRPTSSVALAPDKSAVSSTALEGLNDILPKSSSFPYEKARSNSSSSDEAGIILDLKDKKPQSNSYLMERLEESEQARNSRSESRTADLMMTYSNSEAALSNMRSQSTSARPRVLADLDSHDLKMQLRYFYITKEPEDVDRNNLIRCLVCAQEGHMAPECTRFVCTVCNSKGKHFTKDCPTLECSTCHEPGHNNGDCHLVSESAQRNATCKLCKRKGHVQRSCELLWRTAPPPWKTNTMSRFVRLECYECGNGGHLGNDCPTRRPRKPMGSSTWTFWHQKGDSQAKDDTHIRGRAKQEPTGASISIKGRAKRQLSSFAEDEEWAGLPSPTVARPGPPRRINIAAGTGQSVAISRVERANLPSPTNEEPNQYRGRDHDSTGYGVYRRRSVSPRRVDFGASRGYRGGYAPYPHQPPLPQEPLPFRLHPQSSAQQSKPAETYHPMPSAARNAWTQFR